MSNRMKELENILSIMESEFYEKIKKLEDQIGCGITHFKKPILTKTLCIFSYDYKEICEHCGKVLKIFDSSDDMEDRQLEMLLEKKQQRETLNKEK